MNAMSTERLYDADPYLRAFDALVTEACPADAAGKILVVTDRTAFFPEGGGQSPDGGTLAGFPVTDVQLRPDGGVVHTVEIGQGGAAAGAAAGATAGANAEAAAVAGGIPEALLPGQTVHGEIDWGHRFSNMQNHTGEHILSGLMHGQYGFDNIGFHLSDNSVTLDVNGHLTDEQVRALETAANEVVWRNVPVTARYPDAAELETLVYRSKKEIDGPLRVVTVEGVDNCACCAPHVSRTGEIGLIRIVRVLRYAGGMRLTILCGRRALASVQSMQAQAEAVSHLTNSPQEQIADAAARLLAEVEAERHHVRELEERIAQIHLESAPGGNAWIFEKHLSVLPQRALVNALCDRLPEGGGLCGVFAGEDGSGYMYIAGGRGADARTVSGRLRERLGAKGGGRPEMVQGSVQASKEEILRALSEL